MKNIVLTGFMGTGKTLVSRKLAGELGKDYVSTDEMIIKREDKPIKDIFADSGEEYFRDIEQQIVEEISEKIDQIIDTGGGVVLNDINIANLKLKGIVICLWTDPEEIYLRTKEDGTRPLLNVDDPMRKITDLLEKRRPFYEKADHHIDTTEWEIDTIVQKIKKIMEKYG
jgi:shikimate kinase